MDTMQVVFKCRIYRVDLRRVVVSKQWSLKAGGLLIQVVCYTVLTELRRNDVSETVVPYSSGLLNTADL